MSGYSGRLRYGANEAVAAGTRLLPGVVIGWPVVTGVAPPPRAGA